MVESDQSDSAIAIDRSPLRRQVAVRFGPDDAHWKPEAEQRLMDIIVGEREYHELINGVRIQPNNGRHRTRREVCREIFGKLYPGHPYRGFNSQKRISNKLYRMANVYRQELAKHTRAGQTATLEQLIRPSRDWQQRRRTIKRAFWFEAWHRIMIGEGRGSRQRTNNTIQPRILLESTDESSTDQQDSDESSDSDSDDQEGQDEAEDRIRTQRDSGQRQTVGSSSRASPRPSRTAIGKRRAVDDNNRTRILTRSATRDRSHQRRGDRNDSSRNVGQPQTPRRNAQGRFLAGSSSRTAAPSTQTERRRHRAIDHDSESQASETEDEEEERTSRHETDPDFRRETLGYLERLEQLRHRHQERMAEIQADVVRVQHEEQSKHEEILLKALALIRGGEIGRSGRSVPG